MKFVSNLYDQHDDIMEGIRMVAKDEWCCQFHCQHGDTKLLPPLCERCRRKLMGLREYLEQYNGKYLVVEHG